MSITRFILRRLEAGRLSAQACRSVTAGLCFSAGAYLINDSDSNGGLNEKMVGVSLL